MTAPADAVGTMSQPVSTEVTNGVQISASSRVSTAGHAKATQVAWAVLGRSRNIMVRSTAAPAPMEWPVIVREKPGCASTSVWIAADVCASSQRAAVRKPLWA